MIGRLSTIIYWTGSGIAVVLALYAILALILSHTEQRYPRFLISLFFAAAAWGVGRICRHMATSDRTGNR